jgi:hypothetical protein
MSNTGRIPLLLLALVICILTGPAAAHVHSRKLQQLQHAVGTAETDAAAAALLATAQEAPPEIPPEQETELAIAAAAEPPTTKRACGTYEGTRGERAANERRFQQKLQQLQASGEDVSVAQAPVIQVVWHVVMLNNVKGVVTQVNLAGTV